MKKGYIYKITNLINGKIYVGQTNKTIQSRFLSHISDSKKTDKKLPSIHKALKKYGRENFIIEELECCDEKLLNKREIYWIKNLQSFKFGYNETLGGCGVKTLDIDELEVIKTYKKVQTITETAKRFNVSHYTIAQILKKYNVHVFTVKEIARRKGLKVYYIKNGIRHDFDSLKIAAEWAISKSLTNSDYKVVAAGIRNVILNGKRLYGYNWYSDDFSKEYILDQREKEKQLKIEKQPLLYIKSKNNCPICGGQKTKESKTCQICFFKNKRNVIHNEKPIPDRKLLKDLIRNFTFTHIGKMYDISDNSVKKWCKRMQLPFKKIDINSFTDEEWNLI